MECNSGEVQEIVWPGCNCSSGLSGVPISPPAFFAFSYSSGDSKVLKTTGPVFVEKATDKTGNQRGNFDCFVFTGRRRRTGVFSPLVTLAACDARGKL